MPSPQSLSEYHLNASSEPVAPGTNDNMADGGEDGGCMEGDGRSAGERGTEVDGLATLPEALP